MALEAVLGVQLALSVISGLLLTAYLFPKQATVENYDQYDFIIVGGGSAGSVVADRLSENPSYKVLVIDAGGDPPLEAMVPSLFSFLPHSKYDWNFTSENDNYSAQSHTTGALDMTIGKVLGGGSTMNYMFYVRGCPGDYDSWAEIAQDDTWNYENSLPYLIKSERLEDEEILYSPDGAYHGTDGFLGITRENTNKDVTTKYLKAFEEVGHDIVPDVNGRNSIGYALPMYTIAEGLRQTTAYTNLGKNKNRPNLHVLKNTFVYEILIDDNNSAIGVKVRTEDDKHLVLLARKEVIVSAGGLNSPKLLMLSGIGPKEHLQSMNIKVRSDLPVGMNLQDHVPLPLSFKMETSNATLEPSNPHQFPLTNIVGYARINESQTCAEYQVFNFIIPHDSEVPYSICAFNNGYKESICRNLLEAGKGRNTVFAIITQLHPKSRGRVTLRSKNPCDAPIVKMGTFSNEKDLEDYTSYVQDYTKVVNSSYFRSVNSEIVNLNIERCKDWEFGSREYWKCYVLYMTSTMYHYAGTCAMNSVVNSQLQVLNIKRLRVADTSVLPTLPSGNPNAVAIMVGEKVSDFIKEEYPVNTYIDDWFGFSYIRKFFCL